MNSSHATRRWEMRRKQERRNNPFEFNSKEWIACIQHQYLLWPKQDRRQSDRRLSERREVDRRAQRRNQEQAHFQRVQVFSSDSILIAEEKQMIQALFAEDDSE